MFSYPWGYDCSALIVRVLVPVVVLDFFRCGQIQPRVRPKRGWFSRSGLSAAVRYRRRLVDELENVLADRKRCTKAPHQID